MALVRSPAAWCCLGLLSCALLLLWPLSDPGVIKAYDWGLQIAWIERFHHALTEGALWPQWLADADGGRGAPVFVYYPPLAYYLAAAFRELTGSAASALEWTQASALLLLYVAAFRLFLSFAAPQFAAAFALMCCFAPGMLFVTLRVHMLGAAVALAAFPLVLLALASRVRAHRALMLALGVAWIGWSHLPSLLMSFVLIVLWATCVAPPVRDRWTLSGLALGLLMAAAPMAPALFEGHAVSLPALKAGALDWRSNFLFMPTETAASFRSDYVFLTVALLLNASSLVGVAMSWWRGQRATPMERTAMDSTTRASWITALVALALCSPLAWPIYAALPPLQMLQFPWRWLPFGSILTLLAVVSCWPVLGHRYVWLLLCVLASGFGYLSITTPHLDVLVARPNTTPTEERWMIEQMPRAAPEYRPRALAAAHPTLSALEPGPGAATSSADIRIQPIMMMAELRLWTIDADGAGVVHLGVACFPGWFAKVNDQPVALSCDEQGLAALAIASGPSTIRLQFEPTPIRWFARGLSVLGLLTWLGLWTATHRRSFGRN